MRLNENAAVSAIVIARANPRRLGLGTLPIRAPPGAFNSSTAMVRAMRDPTAMIRTMRDPTKS
jgi:hypothetical protein